MTSAFRIFLALVFAAQIPLALLHSDSAHAKGRKHTSKFGDDDDEKKSPITYTDPNQPDPEECDGDPYLRCEHVDMTNQNCDPSFLLDLYKHFRLVNCLTSYVGFCANPSADDIFYGVTAGGSTLAAKVGIEWGKGKIDEVAGKRLSAMEKAIQRLNAEQAAMNKQIQAVRAAVAAENAAAGSLAGTPESLLTAQVEKKMTAARLSRAVFSGSVRGLIVGALVTAAWTFWDSEYRQAITDSLNPISSTGCAATDENDENVVKYMPREPGTCKTGIYSPGHPKVLAFLELPTEQKLKILRENKLLCGYYWSLNNELIARAEKLNGKTKIKNVQCNAGSGEITFQAQDRLPETFYKIRRDPKKKDILSYSYEQRSYGVLDDAATFTLTKEDDENFTVSRTSVYNHVALMSTIYTNEKLVQFSRGQPEKAAKTFEAFRTVRKFAPVLAYCCDQPPPELKEYRKAKPDQDTVHQEQKTLAAYNKICHPSWFGRSAAPSPGDVRSAR